MKSINQKTLGLFLFTGMVSMLLSSCYKKFDTRSYQPPFTINGYTSSAEIGAGSLVGYWSFDGNLVDSVSGTAGTNNGTGFAPGFKGQALQGAVNSYVLFPPTNALKNMQSGSITYWINTPQNTNGIVEPICFANSSQFWSNLDMFYENGSTATSATFKVHVFGTNGTKEAWYTPTVSNPWNSWQHVALTYDATSGVMTLYFNGTKIGSTNAGVGPLNFSTVPNIVFGTVQFQTSPSQTTGSGSQSWANFLTGQLDEVRIYNKVLTPDEITALIVLQGKGK